jgi:dipeptidyl aminopeptidase/acylaminoacyl peptidase
VHGRADKPVSLSNTEPLSAALRAQGMPVETRIYDARGHIDMLAALSLPGRLRAPVLQDIAQFLRSLDAAGCGSTTPFGAAPASLN